MSSPSNGVALLYSIQHCVGTRERCWSDSTRIMNTPPKLSSPEPTPIMTVTPAKEEDDPRLSRQRQLVPASRFGLPDGWFVDERPRPSGPTVDKVSILYTWFNSMCM